MHTEAMRTLNIEKNVPTPLEVVNIDEDVSPRAGHVKPISAPNQDSSRTFFWAAVTKEATDNSGKITITKTYRG